MRRVFKFLLIGFALTLASSAAAQEQSYRIGVAPGFNPIANHLKNGRNTLNEVLPEVPDRTLLYKWDATTQRYREAARYVAGSGWSSGDPLMATLAPGEGALLRVDTLFALTFTGLPHSPEVRHDTAAGYNLVSCQTAQRCSFAELFGFPPVPGDTVYKLRQPIAELSTDPASMASSIHRYSATGWDTVPSFDPGRSAFVYLDKTLRIVDQPDGQTVLTGTTVQFSVHAIGAQPLSYQWLFQNEPMAGQTSNTLTLHKVVLSNAGPYSVIVSNPSGMLTSKVARLQVLSPPRILEQPRAQVQVLGQTATFKVLAEGTAPLKYQWIFEGNVLRRETNAMLMIPNVSTNDQGKYWVEITNPLGNVTSSSASLTVLIPPYIITQPKSTEANINDTVTFFVEADGTQPLRYQWLRNGVNLPDETNSFLRIQGVQAHHGGSYRVVVANAAGAIQSDAALLHINIPFRVLADHFADSQHFRAPTALFRATNRGATVEPREPLHAGKHGGKSVWFAWMSDKDGIVTFRTRGSHFDTLLAAYLGDRVDALTEVASDEDSGGYFSSDISFNVTARTDYYIAIDGYNAADGEMIVEWFFEPTDERLPLILQQPIDQIVSLGAEVSFGVRADAAAYQWFFNGNAIDGGTGPVLTLKGVDLDDAGTYYVAVMAGRRVTLSRMASLQFSVVGADGELLPLFSRDKFADIVERGSATVPATASAMAAAAPPVHGYNGSQLFSTVGAIKEDGEPNHCDEPGGASYWYPYRPPASGQAFLNTDGSSFNTVLAVYTTTGTTFADLVEVACDNNSGANGLTSSLNFPAVAGVNYYVVVDGVGGAAGNVRLNYKLLLPMVISNTSMTNSLRFRVTATPTLPFTIQRSSNLSTWTSILTTNTASGIFDYRDTNTTVRRFYRIMQIP